MLQDRPLYWFLSPYAREIVRVVYSQKKAMMSLQDLRTAIDPFDTAGTQARRAAIMDAVQLGFLVLGRNAGVVVVCAPWVKVEEVIHGHKSVIMMVDGRAVLRPVAPSRVDSENSVKSKSSLVSSEAIEKVWDAFLRVTGKRYILNAQRRRACKVLAEKYSLEDIDVAFKGLMRSDWHCGANEQGKEYIEPHIVARNFERFYKLGGGADE